MTNSYEVNLLNCEGVELWVMQGLSFKMSVKSNSNIIKTIN